MDLKYRLMLSDVYAWIKYFCLVLSFAIFFVQNSQFRSISKVWKPMQVWLRYYLMLQAYMLVWSESLLQLLNLSYWYKRFSYRLTWIQNFFFRNLDYEYIEYCRFYYHYALKIIQPLKHHCHFNVIYLQHYLVENSYNLSLWKVRQHKNKIKEWFWMQMNIINTFLSLIYLPEYINHLGISMLIYERSHQSKDMI